MEFGYEPSKIVATIRSLLAEAESILERVKGIEPSSSAWKAVALPLSYTRNFKDLRGIGYRLRHLLGTGTKRVLTRIPMVPQGYTLAADP